MVDIVNGPKPYMYIHFILITKKCGVLSEKKNNFILIWLNMLHIFLKNIYIYISIVCRMSWKDVLHLIIIQGTQKFEISILTITYYGQIKIQEICVLNAINVIKFHKKCLEKYNLWKEYQKLMSLDAYMLFSRIPATLRSL